MRFSEIEYLRGEKEGQGGEDTRVRLDHHQFNPEFSGSLRKYATERTRRQLHSEWSLHQRVRRFKPLSSQVSSLSSRDLVKRLNKGSDASKEWCGIRGSHARFTKVSIMDRVKVPFVEVTGSYVLVWRPCQEGTREHWTSGMSSRIHDLHLSRDAVGVRVQENSEDVNSQSLANEVRRSLLWLTRLEWEELVQGDQADQHQHDSGRQLKPLRQKHRMVPVEFGLIWLAEAESQCQLRTSVLMNLESYERMICDQGKTGVESPRQFQ